jgi:uncharacterized membrane protein YfcA
VSAQLFVVFYLVMAAVATGFSALGQGGGVLYTPIQLFFGIDFHTAATTSLLLIMVVSLSSTQVFRKAGLVDWPMALVLESSTTLGAFLGGLFSWLFTGRALTYLFAAVIATAALFMVRRFQRKANCESVARDFYHWTRQVGKESYCINLGVALPVSFAAGIVSGLVGVSGGILKVPMMVLLFGVPMGIAVGSSAFMVGLTASGGFLGHLAAGQFDWKVALALAPGVFLGAQIGARLGVRVDKQKMKTFFGYFLLALAILLVIRTAVK